VAAFLDQLADGGSYRSRRRYGAAVRHFLAWVVRSGISVSQVDQSLVDRFDKHQCSCSGFNPHAFQDRDYSGRVRRFVRFLEDRGDVPVSYDIDDLAGHLIRFADHLAATGYGSCVRRGYRAAAEHLACWLRLSRVRWCDVDDIVLDRFIHHDCRCPIRRKRGALAVRSGPANRRRGAQHFLCFLQKNGALPPTAPVPQQAENLLLSEYRIWLERHRGAAAKTIERYIGEASRWLPALGLNPAAFDASTIRKVVLDQDPLRARASVRMTITVLRSYLRFLVGRGKCRPALVHAIPPAPQRRLAPLVRYVSPADIERIIAACATSTPIGVRDRAIILLLARLGLRAGDVWRMRLSDIDWPNARLRLYGKEHRASSMPLPQDVGDALLAYLEQIRPHSRQERVFLRIQAPFKPFAGASEIAGIVARVLSRGGIDGVPTGAHVFRHSLATSMLRSGANLEAVGTVLRHRSQSATAIYAKVDVAMLDTVAQPWLGDASC
jgi:integrase